MARSLWNGTIAFGVVRTPVKLYTATESKSIRFRERHATDGGAIAHRRVCVQEDREVPYDEIVKGFEVAADTYVTLSKDEVAAVDGAAARTIAIEHFVSAGEIDPLYYDHAYYVGPGNGGEEGWALLHAALRRARRVGIGRFVFHNKAQLVALRPLRDVLALHTMRFADELVAPSELEIGQPSSPPTERELATARMLVEQLEGGFQPHKYRDTYREAVLDVIARKARGESIAAPSAEPAATGDGLLDALERSLAQGGRGRRRESSHKDGKGARGGSRGGRKRSGAGGGR